LSTKRLEDKRKEIRETLDNGVKELYKDICTKLFYEEAQRRFKYGQDGTIDNLNAKILELNEKRVRRELIFHANRASHP